MNKTVIVEIDRNGDPDDSIDVTYPDYGDTTNNR